MGILTEGINEVIATTAGEIREDEITKVRPNAAPMGIFCRKGKIRMRVYRGTHTEENMRRCGWVIANVTHDPVVFVETAFGDIGAEHFSEVHIDGHTMNRLKDCEAWVAYKCAIIHAGEELSIFELHPVAEEVRSCAVHPHNRGFASVIDATILGTRYVMFNDPSLLEKIQYHQDIAVKCGSERVKSAVKMLDEVVGISVN
ncbi:hypothetical protein AZH53_03025 [Methanomicrobiaceae archaeon CYW5]|nr:hypothetical protein [Methanovulcanius yangii]